MVMERVETSSMGRISSRFEIVPVSSVAFPRPPDEHRPQARFPCCLEVLNHVISDKQSLPRGDSQPAEAHVQRYDGPASGTHRMPGS